MDDLLGEDWQSAPKQPTSPPLQPNNFAAAYNGFRASPQPQQQSGNASPLNLSRPSSTVNNAPKIGSKPTTPAGDAFGNLTSLPSQKAANNLSIQERQKQLIEEKRRQQNQQAQLWDNLGSGRGTPDLRSPSPAAAQSTGEDVDDILAAFNRSAPVDKASHYPPPPSGAASGRSTPTATQPPAAAPTSAAAFDDDDDPFGLAEIAQKSNEHASKQPAPAVTDEDDILGDLGRPVAPKPARQPSPVAAAPEWDENVASNRSARGNEAQDRALAELVDMGFPSDTAKVALAETGGDVQNAVGWLLQQAHAQSKKQAQSESQPRRRSPSGGSRGPASRQRGDQDGAAPSWMREQSRSSSAARREDNRSPAEGDRDASQMASEFGTKLFKSANSIWKASQKQMAKTMADFQQERNTNQPKWMTEGPSGGSSRSNSQRRQPPPSAAQQATDEAAMLDAPREVLPQRPARSSGRETSQGPPSREVAQQSQQRASPQPRSMEKQSSLDKRPTAKLSRQDVEDQSAQAYVSPARRKKSTPKPEPQPEPEVDLFGPAPTKPATTPTIPKTASRPSAAPSPRPQAAPRSVPPTSPSALSSSADHRKRGGEAFRRGDFAAAHESYTAALSPLPPTHPIAIIVLCNRALTAIKTGDPKLAVSDADQALSIIGPSQGANESIDLGAGEGAKDMRESFGKALMRKAEALEHMEKWADAAAVWKQAVQAGVGGAVAIRGRDRCEKTAAPKQAPKPKAAPTRSAAPSAGKAPPAKSMGNSMQRPALSSATSAEAVKRLREANAAAEKADDEKFALTDAVEARLTAWKGGKADNLRALLQSLDGVLWEGAGWKKVGMSDLVMPNKVKIVYMKAIGKVHPDKVSSGRKVGMRCLRLMDWFADTPRRQHRAEDDQRRCVQHAQRGLGQVQEGQQSVRRGCALVLSVVLKSISSLVLRDPYSRSSPFDLLFDVPRVEAWLVLGVF